MQSKRLIQLECARGIASILVILHHFSLAFLPQLKAPFWNGGLRYTPAYAIFNGSGAVTYFFMLSGFVLTLSFYKNFSRAKLLIAIAKRLPRLMGPAGLSIFLGYLIMMYLPAVHNSASEITGSNWLAAFGNANAPDNLQPSVLDAMRQSLFVFLVPNDYYYNSNLWTMRSEFYGSLVVFGLVAAAGCAGPNKHWFISSLHVLSLFLFAFLYHSFVPFVVGSYLAYYIQHRVNEIKVSSGPTLMLTIGAFVGFSVGHWLAHSLASLFLMIILLGNLRVSLILSGKMGEILGNLSFPLYLVHTLVILSLSSYIFMSLSQTNLQFWSIQLITFCVTIFASVLLSLPFLIFDKHWVSGVNKLMSRLLNVQK